MKLHVLWLLEIISIFAFSLISAVKIKNVTNNRSKVKARSISSKPSALEKWTALDNFTTDRFCSPYPSSKNCLDSIYNGPNPAVCADIPTGPDSDFCESKSRFELSELIKVSDSFNKQIQIENEQNQILYQQNQQLELELINEQVENQILQTELGYYQSVFLYLPLTFQSSTLNYTFYSEYDAVTTIIDNPYPNEVNPTTKVASFQKNAKYSTTNIYLSAPFKFTNAANKIKMKFWSETEIPIKLVFSSPEVTRRASLNNTKLSQWEDLTFDFSAALPSEEFQRIEFQINYEIDGNAQYYFDEIIQSS